MGTPEVMGPYVIYERLGAGGMATVHRAEQIGIAGFRKQIALKRLFPHVAADPTMLKMFTHEARLASHLRHGNVAQIYDLGKEGETYFIAMEYVQGPTLTQIMKQCGVASGSMPVPIVLSILAQICDALDHAHNLADDTGKPLGIIHRDVSPANIIVSTTGVVKLIDFGIAKVADAGDAQTAAGIIKGKYAYIAPEYTLGHLDLRADLFGLGVIAHELFTTRRLFNAPTDFETIKRLREMPIQPPSRWNPQITPDVDDIVMTALQRDPSLRWQSASAMRTAIHTATRTNDAIVTNQQLAEWVEWCFNKERRKSEPALARALDSLGETTSGSKDLTTNQMIELEALGAIVEASQATIPQSSTDEPTRAGKLRRTSAHVIRRPSDVDEEATRVAGVAYDEAAHEKQVAEASDAETRVAAKAYTDELVTDKQGPAAAVADAALEMFDDNDSDTTAQRAAKAAATFPVSEDSGVVLSAATAGVETSAPATRKRRVWPWIVLALVLLAGGAAAYLYFVEGLVPDLNL